MTEILAERKDFFQCAFVGGNEKSLALSGELELGTRGGCLSLDFPQETNQSERQ